MIELKGLMSGRIMWRIEASCMKVNVNKTKVMISGEWQKVMQKAVRWPCGVCAKGVGNNSKVSTQEM